MLAWFLSLFRRRRRHDASPIREAEAYARSYGDRSGDVLSVARVEQKPTKLPELPERPKLPEQPTLPELPEPEAELPDLPDLPQLSELKPISRRTGDLTGELLRRAFEAKLDSRSKHAT